MLPALALGLGLIAPDLAQAAPGSAICRSIETQLSRGGGGTNRRYSAAAERQAREISIVRRQMASAGCGIFNGSARCASLSRTASRMNSNLGQLRAKAGGGSNSRSRLLAALNANDCRGTRKPSPLRENSQGIMARLFGDPYGDRGRNSRDQFAYWSDNRGDGASVIRRGGRDRIARRNDGFVGLPPGTVRTFCVRTCDGYYFPMSPASSHGDMARDEQNCQAACPGAETKLYFHQDGQEDAEAMISRIDGNPYAKLKTAFAYREASTLKAPQCSCAAQPGSLKLVSTDSGKTTQKGAAIPLPANRPDPAADPETLANRDGELDAVAMRRMLNKGVEEELAIAQRTVRVVGPMFLPDPAKAAVQLVPDQTEVP